MMLHLTSELDTVELGGVSPMCLNGLLWACVL